jgi:hypothetical protein
MEYSEGVGGDMDLFHETNGYLIFPTLATFVGLLFTLKRTVWIIWDTLERDTYVA